MDKGAELTRYFLMAMAVGIWLCAREWKMTKQASYQIRDRVKSHLKKAAILLLKIAAGGMVFLLVSAIFTNTDVIQRGLIVLAAYAVYIAATLERGLGMALSKIDDLRDEIASLRSDINRS